MNKERGRSVFLNYLISNLSIVVLTCAIIGLALSLYFLDTLRKIQTRTIQEKMDLVLQDLDVQFDELASIALKIQINPVFNPYQQKNNKYADIEMIEELIKFTHNSVFSEQYFFFYHKDSLVFRCDGRNSAKGTSLDFRYYCQYLLGHDDHQTLFQTLSEVDYLQVVPLAESNPLVLVALPVRTTRVGDPSGKATLCFVIARETLSQRMQTVSGGLSQGAVTFSGQLLVGSLLDDAADRLVRTDQDGRFSVSVDLADNQFLADYLQLTNLNMLVLAVLIFFVLILAGLLAYYNYKPIRTVFAKYIFARDNRYGLPASNELRAIDRTLKQIIDSNQDMNIQLREKVGLLKTQILRLILSGAYSEALQSRLDMIQVDLPGPYFSVIELSERDGLVSSDDVLLTRIEQLADENARLYPILHEDRGGITILVSLSEQDYLAEISEDILALCDAEGRSCRIGLGRVCRSLQTIAYACLDARSAATAPDQAEPGLLNAPIQDGSAVDDTGAVIDRFINALSAGDESCLGDKLEAVGQILRQSESSQLRLRYYLADIASRVVKTARSLDIALPEEQVSLIFWAQNADDFMVGLSDLVRQIFRDNRNPQREDPWLAHRKAKEIRQYICTHATDYDISLDSIANCFGISVSGVGRLIKSISNMNFKEYLIRLRIEQAKTLLTTTDQSINEICRLVGYTNNSHFIKNFKREVGVTPLSYRKIKEDERSC